MIQKLFVVTQTQKRMAKKEDRLLTQACAPFFSSELIDLERALSSPIDPEACYLFRNTWGDAQLSHTLRAAYPRFKDANMMYLNHWDGKGDQQGKSYLVDLFHAGHPVIPTYTTISEALATQAKTFLLKPIFGGSSEGILTRSAKDLESCEINASYVIQPKLPFQQELSFFFLNKTFQYALCTRFHRWDLVRYEPTDHELAVARHFIEWNPVVGIQRVDFLKQKDGTILLLELEDWCPYLSLFDVRGLPKEVFIKNLIDLVKFHA
jgi:hypothetical protein